MKGVLVEGGPEGKVSVPIIVELPPEPRYVGTGRMIVAAVARQLGFDDEQVEDLKVAVSEAMTNAMRAHMDSQTEDPVRIEITMGEDLVVEIVDRGGGFDPDQPQAFGATPLPGMLEGGLGLTLVRSLVPDTTIAREDGGMRLRMNLRRAPQP